jgi:hypothetical protein
MGLNEVVAALDDEIGRLQQVRSLLARTKVSVTHAGTSFAFGANQAKPRKRRHLSAEARERIAAAQRITLGGSKEEGSKVNGIIHRSRSLLSGLQCHFLPVDCSINRNFLISDSQNQQNPRA